MLNGMYGGMRGEKFNKNYPLLDYKIILNKIKNQPAPKNWRGPATFAGPSVARATPRT